VDSTLLYDVSIDIGTYLHIVVVCGGYTIRSGVAKNSMLHANFMALCFIEPELLPIKVLHCGSRDFRPFSSFDHDLDPMTLPRPRRASRMVKNVAKMAVKRAMESLNDRLLNCCRRWSFAEQLISQQIDPDEHQFMRMIKPQWMIDFKSPFKIEAQGPGGLRLALMHNLTHFDYYVIIVINEGEIVLRYA